MLEKLVIFGIGYVLGTRAGKERFDELVEANDLMPRALAFAHLCADGPNKAIGFMKLALTEGLEMPIHDSFAYERHLQNQLFDTADSKEGVKAFLEKRQPQWGKSE